MERQADAVAGALYRLPLGGEAAMSIPGEDGYETPDDGPPSKTPATDFMLEEGCHTDVIDLLCDMLVKRGMTRDEVDAALNKACGEWLSDEYD